MSENKRSNINNYNNGLIDGVIFCEEEERKLQHGQKAKSKIDIGGLFKFPDLNE